MITAEQETAELQALSEEIATHEQSRWQPACIARAFATPGDGEVAFTMQAWIDLERMRSPLLHGEMPETAEEFAAAAAVFDLDISDLDAEEIADLGQALRRAIAEGFAMGLPMTPAEEGQPAAPGFGDWLPTWTALLVECHIAPSEARRMKVGEALATLAGLRRLQGWQVAGVPYALRDLEKAETHQPSE
ncbi:MAG TPA: hypothetical protein VF614_16665 [Chthoniobacteraceae bacterium]|jgi:hypothetical protein